MGHSLRTAAAAAGTSKSTILRAIKSGRISATRLDDGGYSIDESELARVYPPVRSAQRPISEGLGQDAPASATPAPDGATQLATLNAALNAEIAGLKELVRRLDSSAEDIRADRDKWRAMAEQGQRLLVDARPSRPWWKLWA